MADYDLIIIGSGAAGFSAAMRAKNLGVARIAIIERGTLWGTCVNYGCVPSKFLITLADLAYYRNYHHDGLRVESTFARGLLRKKRLLSTAARTERTLASRATGRGSLAGICGFPLPARN